MTHLALTFYINYAKIDIGETTLKLKIFVALSLAFLLPLFAFAQQPAQLKRLDARASAQAWTQASIPLPDNTPSISGGGLVVESEPNGTGRKIWLPFSKSGTYLMQGKTCNDNETVKLGDIGDMEISDSQTGLIPVFDSNAMNLALPFFPQICQIEVIRLDKGRIERSSVEINPWWQTSEMPKYQATEGVGKDGRYYIATGALPPDATVILGRYNIATEVQRSPAGSIVLFSPNMSMPSLGQTTFTVCSRGKCGTTTFERKLEVPWSGGKG